MRVLQVSYENVNKNNMTTIVSQKFHFFLIERGINAAFVVFDRSQRKFFLFHTIIIFALVRKMRTLKPAPNQNTAPKSNF